MAVILAECKPVVSPAANPYIMIRLSVVGPYYRALQDRGLEVDIDVDLTLKRFLMSSSRATVTSPALIEAPIVDPRKYSENPPEIRAPLLKGVSMVFFSTPKAAEQCNATRRD